MPMIRLVAGLAALAWSAAACAAGFTDPAEIDATVTRFTGAAIGEPGGARLPADRRMRLEACTHPLTAEWHGRGGQTVLVRCPAPGGWRVFVPVLSGGAPDVPPVDAVPLVDRGEAVTIAVSGRGFTLTRQGQALESGAAGEWVRVRPAGTRRSGARAGGEPRRRGPRSAIDLEPGGDGRTPQAAAGHARYASLRTDFLALALKSSRLWPSLSADTCGVGSMNPIDVARLNVAQRLRADVPAPVSAASPAASARDVTNGTGPGKGASTGVSAVERLSAGAAAPFDAERVAALREAIGQGRYPVIPDRIADAMIAAGHLFKADR